MRTKIQKAAKPNELGIDAAKREKCLAACANGGSRHISTESHNLPETLLKVCASSINIGRDYSAGIQSPICVISDRRSPSLNPVYLLPVYFITISFISSIYAKL